MIFALMLTCGWRRSRLRGYASRSASALGMSVMLRLFVIESAVTAPRTGQFMLVPCGAIWIGCGLAPGGVMPAPGTTVLGVVGQTRVNRAATMGAMETALE